MSYVLDTNIFSALVRGEPVAVNRLLALSPRQVFLPSPVVAEVHYGLERMPRSRRKTELEKRCSELFGTLQRINWTDEVSRKFGTIKAELERAGERIEDFDIAIAAHALAGRHVLAMANTRHLERIKGLELEDWTKAG